MDDVALLKDLGNDSKIVIKQVNKGGGIALLDKQDYLKEAYRQLSNTQFYRKLKGNPTPEISTIIKVVLNEGLALHYIIEKT